MSKECKNPECVNGFIPDWNFPEEPWQTCPDCKGNCKGTGQEQKPPAEAIIAKVAKAQIEQEYGSVANAITKVCGTGQDDAAEFADKEYTLERIVEELEEWKNYIHFSTPIGIVKQLLEQVAQLQADLEWQEEKSARLDMQRTELQKQAEGLKDFIRNNEGHDKYCGVNSEGFEGCDQTMFLCDCGYKEAKEQALSGERK